ncbi:MFS transporter [Lichenicoccus sp.]|uniref:MFS transporter n=1 Tax=Lichenicoccus sp. TaxID=2781899 RepID=UPI003D0B84A5
MNESRWLSIGGTLMLGLFVAYLDRTNLSVGLPQIARDTGFARARFAVTSSWVLTTFLIGYAAANVVGGVATRGFDPKHGVIACISIWAVATLAIGLASSVAVLVTCRLVLGVAEGIYWPQQSGFAQNWFAPHERTRANGLIQYYGQFLALALGFIALTPIYNAFGWRILFLATGATGLVVIVPLYSIALRPASQAPYRMQATRPYREPLSLRLLGGPAFGLLVFSYVTQGMLFWGITLWLPLVVRSLGFTGSGQGLATALPYLLAIMLAIPMAILSDRTGQRVLIAALGLLLPGVVLLLLPLVDAAYPKLVLITLALGFYASSYTPNIWTILQDSVAPSAVGPASGIMNGLGAGAGGTIAGFLVGLLRSSTGSYTVGFMVLGALVLLGGISLLLYGRVTRSRRPAGPALGVPVGRQS